MSELYFGQFLVLSNLVSGSQLLDAVALQRMKNKLLGEIAVDTQLLTSDQVAHIKERQTQYDVLFGDAAIALGYLNRAQVIALLETQRRHRVTLSSAILALKFLDQASMDAALQTFTSHQQSHKDGLMAVEGCPPVAWLEPLLTTTRRTLLRLANLDTRVSDQRHLKDGSEIDLFKSSVSLQILQPWVGTFTISVADRVALSIAEKSPNVYADGLAPSCEAGAAELERIADIAARLASQHLLASRLTLQARQVDAPPRKFKLNAQHAMTVQLASALGTLLIVYAMNEERAFHRASSATQTSARV